MATFVARSERAQDTLQAPPTEPVTLAPPPDIAGYVPMGLGSVLQDATPQAGGETILAQATPEPAPVPTPTAAPDAAGTPEPGDGPEPTGAIGGGFLNTIPPFMPRPANVIDAIHGTGADTALRILDDVAAGRPPLRPELGNNGPVQWVVSEGTPYTGAPAEVVIPMDVNVPPGAQVLEFGEAELRSIRDAFLDDARRIATEQFFEQRPNASPTSNSTLREIERRARGIAEGNMWTEVGERVAASPDGLGEVILENSEFSRSGNGAFMLTSNADDVTLRGGPRALLDVIERAGLEAERPVVEAAEQLARNGDIVGHLDGVFRVGGRVLIVAGAAADGWRIYQADDRLRETAEVAGGWAGSAAAIAAYNSATGATNVAGPWAWAANAVGNVAAGVAGYFGGEWLAGQAYDLIVDPDPIVIPAE